MRRELLQVQHLRAGGGQAAPSTLTTGYRYAEMGYTAGFEPAMMAVNARQTHLEMGDTPIIDKGGYAMIGTVISATIAGRTPGSDVSAPAARASTPAARTWTRPPKPLLNGWLLYNSVTLFRLRDRLTIVLQRRPAALRICSQFAVV